jgi:hypothetical protein
MADPDFPSITLPAGQFYLTPAGGSEAYIGQTDGADIERQVLQVEERWAGEGAQLYLAEALPIRAETVITVRCQESRDGVLALGLMAAVDESTAGITRIVPRADLSAGAVVALRHAASPTHGRARSLHVARTLVLPNGPVRLKRSAGGGELQVVDLRFRVLRASGEGLDWWFEEVDGSVVVPGNPAAAWLPAGPASADPSGAAWLPAAVPVARDPRVWCGCPPGAIASVWLGGGESGGGGGGGYTLIDSFDVSEFDQTVDRLFPASEATLDHPDLPPNPDPNLAPNILGGYRDLYVYDISGSDNGPFGYVSLFSFGEGADALGRGCLSFAAGEPACQFKGRVTWDGQDSDGATVATAGLGGVSLNSHGETAFWLRFMALTHPATTLTIHVWPYGGGSRATTVVDLSEWFPTGVTQADWDNPVFGSLRVPFSDFGGGVDWGHVGAISMEFEGPPGWEVVIKDIHTVVY